MKKLHLIIPALLIICYNGFTQCPDTVLLQTQLQVDIFLAQYPNCKEIRQDLEIKGFGITSLSGLRGLTSIGKNLNIVLTSIENLSGLDSLTNIGGDLLISSNMYLKDLTGVEKLSVIGNDCTISSNKYLTSLSGLGNLSEINGDYFEISNNNFLISLADFRNLKHLKSSLSISNNPYLISLTGLNSIDTVGGYVILFNNSSLYDLSGLEGLTTIDGTLYLHNNYSLKNIQALHNLHSIGKDLDIRNSDSLLNITGLMNLKTIGRYIQISENNSLTSLTGLDSINSASISYLTLKNNPQLATCDVRSICNYLSNNYDNSSIYNNSPECESKKEILDACTEAVDEQPLIHKISVSPNPVINNLYINSKYCGKVLDIKIFNLTGEIIFSQSNSDNPVDMSSIPAGMYIIDIVTDNSRLRDKIIRQ
jgi:hypothetical protein